MNIKFEEIELKNFLSFKDASIRLNDSGYTLVSGINENPDDNAVSNGSGKSSIWEAISWCLTGETIRGTKDVKRIGCDDECCVTLKFNIDNDKYTLTRSKDPSNLFITINGIDKSGKGIRDTEKLLKEYLPDLTSSLVGSVIILGQGLPQRFTNNTPSGRKEVLEKLSKSDFMISDLKDRIQKRKDVLQTELRNIQDSLVSSNSQVTLLQSLISQTQDKLCSMNNEQLKTDLVTNTEQLKLLEEDLETKNNELHNKKAELEKLSLEAQEKYQLASDEYEKKKDELNNATFELKTKEVELNSNINSLEKEIKRLESITDTCPTCGQKLPDVEKIDTTEQNNELFKLKAEYNEIAFELGEINNSYQKSLDELSKKKLDYSKPSQEQVKVNRVISELSSNISTLENSKKQYSNNILILEEQLKNFDNNKKELEKNIEDSKTQLEELNKKILYYNNKEEEIKKHIDVITKMNTVISRDFRGYLLSNVIQFINDKAKEYSKEVFDTDKISFIQDANNISISYDDKEYECLSGGEKQKVDLIVQLAIRDMLCKFLNFSSNIIVLDELFDNLDSIGCQKVLDLISKNLNDVESIFIVTHHSDISIPCDKEIRVIKGKDKVSRIDL